MDLQPVFSLSNLYFLPYFDMSDNKLYTLILSIILLSLALISLSLSLSPFLSRGLSLSHTFHGTPMYCDDCGIDLSNC